MPRKKVADIDDIRRGFKVLTFDNRPPVQGGDPLWPAGSTFPLMIGPVKLDTGPAECARGFNFCADLATALRIAHLWPNGWPARGHVITASDDAIQRGDKRRASSLTVERVCTDAEHHAAIEVLSRRWFGTGEDGDVMAREQVLWWQALGRPEHDVAAVETGLALALDTRGLKWNLKRFPSAREAWAAREAWEAWEAREAWEAWEAREARPAWEARPPWEAREAWEAWEARPAWEARAALSVYYAGRRGWIARPPELLTVGIRDAYRNGLAIALPTGPDELGWAMVESQADEDEAASSTLAGALAP